MAQTMLQKVREWWSGRSASAGSGERRKFVPHAEWSAWLADGQWDRAAVLLENLRKKEGDEAISRLLPEWEDRLTRTFLKAGWAELSTSTALRWLRRVDRFPDRGLRDVRLERFREVADHLWDADRARNAGESREALKHLEEVRRGFEEAGKTAPWLDDLHRRVAEEHEILLQLAMALRIHEDEGRPVDAAAIARRILAIAPRHRGALTATKRLGAFEMAATRFDHGEPVTEWLAGDPHASEAVTAERISEHVPQSSECGRSATDTTQISLDRGETWLVCDRSKLTIECGDDPRYADLFGESVTDRLILQRDCEGCWLFSSDEGIQVDDKLVRSGCLLDGAKVRLGPNAPAMRFVQPRMETGSARLQRIDRHSPKGVKGLVLLGEMFDLGRNQGEIPHQEISEPLVLARKNGTWVARRAGAWTLEGQEVLGEATLQPPCRIRIGSVGIFWES